MLQNTNVTTFTVSELLWENQHRLGGKTTTPPQLRLGLNASSMNNVLHEFKAMRGMENVSIFL